MNGSNGQYNGIEHGLIMVTPEQANIWRLKNLYEKQRPPRQDHIAFLAGEMEKGRFKQATQIEFAILEGQEKLINGQHTLGAITKSNLPQLLNVVKYHVSSEDEIAELYSRIDIQKTRTIADILNVWDISEKTELTHTHVRKMGAAVILIHSKFQTWRAVPKETIKDLILEYQSEGREYFALIYNCPTDTGKGLDRRATLSLALVTLKYAKDKVGEEKVRDFWRGAAFDDGLKKGDPRKVVNRHVTLTGMRGGGYGRRKEKTTSGMESVRTLAACWNAWVEGKDMVNEKKGDPSAPINILCTPFTPEK